MLLLALAIVASAEPSFVQVIGSKKLGSGVRISSSHVITNHHVIKNEKQITVVCGQTAIRAYLVAEDADEDLALLELDSPASCEGTIAKFPRRGSKGGPILRAYGCPNRECGSTTLGFALRRDPDQRKSEIATTLQFHPGSSGGPAYDLKGTLIGIAKARSVYAFAESMTFGYLISAKYVAKFILSACGQRFGIPLSLQLGPRTVTRYCRASSPQALIPRWLAR